MARTIRGRRTAYDNIASGSATGPERTISGESVSPIEIYGGGGRTSTSNGDVWHTNVAAGVSVSNQNDTSQAENLVATGNGPGLENVDGTSNTTT